ncbi:MAG: hypothetical protein F6K19_14230 [Cyanothece sp. SIO1E1]|nr:hypothetical protein [Cyanothece sp. SIO1E1]
MNSTLDLNQFNYTQIKLLYCAIDSPRYTTELLIERDLPGRAGPSPDLSQADLKALEQDGWVTILIQQIDIESSIAIQVQHQMLIDAIDDPIRAELMAAARPDPPKVVMARIKYQLTDRGILLLTPLKPQLKTQFDRSEGQTYQFGDSSQRSYVISGAPLGNFSIRGQP